MPAAIGIPALTDIFLAHIESPVLWRYPQPVLPPPAPAEFFRTAADFSIAQKQNPFFVRSANRQNVHLPV